MYTLNYTNNLTTFQKPVSILGQYSVCEEGLVYKLSLNDSGHVVAVDVSPLAPRYLPRMELFSTGRLEDLR